MGRAKTLQFFLLTINHFQSIAVYPYAFMPQMKIFEDSIYTQIQEIPSQFLSTPVVGDKKTI